MYIKEVKDLAAHDLRTRQVLELTHKIAEPGALQGSDLFGNFPDRVKDLLQVAGLSPNPLREIRWSLLNVDDHPYHTVYQFDLPYSSREIEQLLIKLRSGWRSEGESRLLAFGFKPKKSGDPAITRGNEVQFKELGKAENEYYHLPLLEDLFRFAEASRPSQNEFESVVSSSA